MKPSNQYQNIVISRTDSIGDVVLTLPVAYVLKKKFPQAKIFFLGKKYTKEVILTNESINEFIDWDLFKDKELFIQFMKDKKIDLFIHVFPNKKIASWAKEANIKTRIGTAHRWYHWLTCNIKPFFSRKKSNLHESQLNLKLIQPLLKKEFSLTEITSFYKLKDIEKFDSIKPYLSTKKKNIILHPKSQNSAREWGDENFYKLIQQIPKEKFNIIITGTKQERDLLKDSILEPLKDDIVDTTGKLSLEELISLITHSDYLVAASTGPLHIAAMCGIHAIGLFVMTRPMHPGRWKPLGKKTSILVFDKNNVDPDSIKKITVKKVLKEII